MDRVYLLSRTPLDYGLSGIENHGYSGSIKHLTKLSLRIFEIREIKVQ